MGELTLSMGGMHIQRGGEERSSIRRREVT
jgi:hypothetical protein